MLDIAHHVSDVRLAPVVIVNENEERTSFLPLVLSVSFSLALSVSLSLFHLRSNDDVALRAIVQVVIRQLI